MSDAELPPVCPDCGLTMPGAGLVLMEREDDGRSTCRAAWKCGNGHVWWQWADRPGLPLERCPIPEDFR